MFMSINTSVSLMELLLFSFSRHLDYRWESGLSDPCDVHRCRQTVSVSFHRSVGIDEYGI